jgi:DNA-binding NarL/FixJ family response regulator
VIDFAQEHQPDVIIFDVAIPYEENWTFLRLLQSSDALKSAKWVITTTHRKRLEELVGECGEVYEVVGKPYDLVQITQAVQAALDGSG